MSLDLEATLDALVRREGGYVNNPLDKGGPTRWGVTEQVARAHGYAGDMRGLPVETAREIYRSRYWTDPHFDLVALRAPAIAAELLDTGVNMGPETAGAILQRALNALNREASAYPDVKLDGRIGRMTLYALDQFIAQRGPEGLGVLLRLLNALQACRYVEIAEGRPSQEIFLYGWLRERTA